MRVKISVDLRAKSFAAIFSSAIALLAILHGGISAAGVSEKIDSYVESYTKTNDFSGCVLVKKQDKTLHEKCYGKASFEFEVPNSTRTKFKIGSVSKQMTAVGILLLEERGLLRTEDYVSKHLPEYPNAKDITIHHLLTHSSGVLDIYSLPNFQEINRNPLTLEKVTGEIFKNKLLSKPGSAYSYNNSGYTILARIIEKVSGSDYGDFLKKNIFDPLGMKATGDYFDNSVVKDLATGYDPAGYAGVAKPDY